MNFVKNFKKYLTVDKYYRMNDVELANEASKWKIREYGSSNSIISRKIIIEQLIQKDKANNSRYAIIISVFSLITSFIALWL